MPKGGFVRLGGGDKTPFPEPVCHGTPADAFDYAWASRLLDDSLAKLEEECRRTGKTKHWYLFRDSFLRPIMDNSPPPSRARLCRKYGVPDPTMVSNMIVTVKRRFKAIMREQMRPFVASDAEIDDEISYLIRVLSRGGARS
jgi:hypothetical protein